MGVPATLPSNQHVSPHCANTPHTHLQLHLHPERSHPGPVHAGPRSLGSPTVRPLYLGSLLGGADEATGYGSAYGSEPAYGQGLEEPVYNSEFGRRKGLQDVMSPVVAALSNGKKKYEEEEE